MTDEQTTHPPMDDLWAVNDLVFRMGAAFDTYTSQMRRALSLNAHERLAIAALWSRGPLTMTELGTWIPLSRAAVTTLVDRLEEQGLVVRTNDGRDRRRTVVKLADEDMSRMHPVVLPWSMELGQLVNSFPQEEWSTIASFLRKFIDLNERHANRLAEFDDEELQALANGVA